MEKVRWGILSTAKIGVKKVIPAMQQGELCNVTAIASRALQQAKTIAGKLDIPNAYGSYEDLLADPDIDAVYIPLPNHLHVSWSIKTLEAGKHVLCEKPIGLTSKDARRLIKEAANYPNLKVMEAFMYRFHPQWKMARNMVEEGRIGEMKAINSFFSYFNDDPDNIRNRADIGGGGLMDIGCYCISLSRFLFNSEPRYVSGHMEVDPGFKTDRLTSGVLQFDNGTSTFTCSTQLFPHQRVYILGTKGKIEIEIPFNAPPDKQTHIWLTTENETEEMVFEPVNQYTLQADLFTQAILKDTEVPTPLSDAEANMKVIEAIRTSAEQDAHVTL